MGMWPTIENAPRDGSRILLLDKNGGINIGKWCPEWPYQLWAHRGRVSQKSPSPGAWEIYGCSFGRYYSTDEFVIGWLPLPATPLTKESE